MFNPLSLLQRHQRDLPKLEIKDGNANAQGCCSICEHIRQGPSNCFCTHVQASDEAKEYVTYFFFCAGFKRARRVA